MKFSLRSLALVGILFMAVLVAGCNDYITYQEAQGLIAETDSAVENLTVNRDADATYRDLMDARAYIDLARARNNGSVTEGMGHVSKALNKAIEIYVEARRLDPAADLVTHEEFNNKVVNASAYAHKYAAPTVCEDKRARELIEEHPDLVLEKMVASVPAVGLMSSASGASMVMAAPAGALDAVGVDAFTPLGPVVEQAVPQSVAVSNLDLEEPALGMIEQVFVSPSGVKQNCVILKTYLLKEKVRNGGALTPELQGLYAEVDALIDRIKMAEGDGQYLSSEKSFEQQVTRVASLALRLSKTS